ncbi:hypothetical protein PFMALIP_03253 [Plasmodium falciparum MaliPS096_E11]|uniref:Uncharacterized protein n=1 Tax=Plasmodium falciparum MaliPS096_E11 TaxID=1036727 RepID=A0A024WPS8_PLAFA|nr:hypothetical protein PFMALIP_03253 [Plasmodium falciparum MaliPS096_E11]
MEKEKNQFEVTRNLCTTSIKENLECSTNIIKNVNNFMSSPKLDNNYNYNNNILYYDGTYDKEGQNGNEMNYASNTNNMNNINNINNTNNNIDNNNNNDNIELFCNNYSNGFLLNEEYTKGMEYDKIIINEKYCNSPIDTLHNNLQTNKLANVVNSIRFEDNTNIKIPVFLKNSPLYVLYPELNSYIKDTLIKNDKKQESEESRMDGMKESVVNEQNNVENNKIIFKNDNTQKNENYIMSNNNNNNNDDNYYYCGYNNYINNIHDEETKNINKYLSNHIDNNTIIKNKMYDYFDYEKNNMIHILNVNNINDVLLKNEKKDPVDIILNSYKNIYVSKNKNDINMNNEMNTEMNTLNVLKEQKMPILDHNDTDHFLSVEKNMKKKINVLKFKDNNGDDNGDDNDDDKGDDKGDGYDDDNNYYTFDNNNLYNHPDHTHSSKLSKNPLFISFIDTKNKTAKLKTFDINNNQEVKRNQFFISEKTKKGTSKDAQVQTNEEELTKHLTENMVDSDVEHILNIINKKTKKITENVNTQENKEISSNSHILNKNRDITLHNNQTNINSSKYDISYNLIQPSYSDKSFSNTTNNTKGCNTSNSVVFKRNYKNNKNVQHENYKNVCNNKCTMKKNIYTTNMKMPKYNFSTPINIYNDYINRYVNTICMTNQKSGNMNMYTRMKNNTNNMYNMNNKNNTNNMNNMNNKYNNNVYIKHHIKNHMNNSSEDIFNIKNQSLSNINNNNYFYYQNKEEQIKNAYLPFIYHMLNIPCHDTNVNLSFLKKTYQIMEKQKNEGLSKLGIDIQKQKEETYVQNDEHINNKVQINEHEKEDEHQYKRKDEKEDEHQYKREDEKEDEHQYKREDEKEDEHQYKRENENENENENEHQYKHKHKQEDDREYKKSKIIKDLLLKKLDIEKKKKIYEKWKYENYLKTIYHAKGNNSLKYRNKEYFDFLKSIYYNDKNNIHNSDYLDEHTTYNKKQQLLYSPTSLNKRNNNNSYSYENKNNYNKPINDEKSLNYDKNTKLYKSNDHNTIFKFSNKLIPQKCEENNQIRCRSLSYKNRLQKLKLLKESIQHYKLKSNTRNVFNTDQNKQTVKNNKHNHFIQHKDVQMIQNDISNNTNNLNYEREKNNNYEREKNNNYEREKNNNYEREKNNNYLSEHLLLNQKQNNTNNQGQEQNNIKIKYNLKKQNMLKDNYKDTKNYELNYVTNNNTFKNNISTEIFQERNSWNNLSNTLHNETIDNHKRNSRNYHMVGKLKGTTSNYNNYDNKYDNNNNNNNNRSQKMMNNKKNMNMNRKNLLNNINTTKNNNNFNNHLRIKVSVKNPNEESTIRHIKNDTTTKHKSFSNKQIFNKELLNKEKAILSDTEIQFRKKNSIDQPKENLPTNTSNTKNFLKKNNGCGGGNYLKIRPPFVNETNASTRSKSIDTNIVETKNVQHSYLTSDFKKNLSRGDNIFEKTHDEINLENIDPNKWIQKIFGDIH